MVSIRATVEVNASPERVWSIISEVDRESEYWKGLNSAKITKREGNIIEREVDVGFMGHKGYQTVKLSPQALKIDVEMTDGPLIGSRCTKIVSLQGEAKSRLEASWSFSYSKVPIFARGFVKTQIENVTREALEKIAIEAEGKKTVNKVVLSSTSR
jgi:ribosome-associated toxin RatA of RatAB toxin-antitoxin module